MAKILCANIINDNTNWHKSCSLAMATTNQDSRFEKGGTLYSALYIRGVTMKHQTTMLLISSSFVCISPLTFAVDNLTDENRGGSIIARGTSELVLSGAGTSDKNFDNNIFNLNLAYGRYMTEENIVGIRQSVSANNNQEEEETDFNGSTRIFYDYQFDMDDL